MGGDEHTADVFYYLDWNLLMGFKWSTKEDLLCYGNRTCWESLEP